MRKAVFGGNVYNATELAGAFGDLGTLIPFVVGYIVVNKLDPVGILVSLGLLKIFVGLYFKTPVPIQPMKAIGAAAIANPENISPGMIWGSGLFTAVAWIVLALSGAADFLNKIIGKPVMRGIMLGLGLNFVIQGLKMMSDQWVIAVIAIVIAFLLLASKRLPAMLVLLCMGVVTSLILDPDLVSQLKQISVHFKLPQLVFGQISWHDLVMGALVLGVPQVPLTLGNAVLGTVAENNELFPDRPITVKKIALDHGLINIVSLLMRGIPVCHGAGGMAGHVRFGARTGGALVMLGVILLVLGLFFSQSVALLFNMIPAAIVGVILFFAGLELASIVWDIRRKKEDIYVMLVTAGIAIINIGIAFVAGLALYYALQRRVVKV
ncbi:MAG: sulfate transporter [Chloroflexi bacterium RBG_13_48_17]|nr:MAG: sulfate transporter [Chloroflexi bacterium RBG_13_48_17]